VNGIKVCSIKGPGSLQRGDNHKNVKMGLGHLKILFLRTIKPEMLNFTRKLSDIEQRQVDKKYGPEGRMGQMEMKCISYFIWAKVTRVSDVANGPLVYINLAMIQIAVTKGSSRNLVRRDS
jgi:hypothetical protein